jgi:glycosyltransferase involved in cell wall biosynthesis
MRMNVVMIGTSPYAFGGVAAVVEVYRRHGFFDRFGVVYLESHGEGSAFKKLGMAVLAGCARTLFHLHSGTFEKFAGANPQSLRRRWIAHTLRSCDAVITLSEPAAQLMRELSAQARVTTIANPVALKPAAEADVSEPHRLLFLGRAGRRKGIYELLEALAALRAEFPALRLAIGGDGDLEAVRRRARELGVEDLIEVLGWTTGAQKQQQIARASVYVLPSRAEGLPIALLECMAQGKAVMTTPVGGIPEVVRDGVNGCLVQPGEVAGIVECLRELLRDPALRERLGAQARRTIELGYGPEQVLARVAALYEQLGVAPRQEAG